MGPTPSMRPDRDTGDRLARHPLGVRALGLLVDYRAAKRDRDSRNQTPLQTVGRAGGRADRQATSSRMFLDSMAARWSAERSRRSSFATLVSGNRSGRPVPITNRLV